MTDGECIEFLQALLPRLRLRWPGFRKVRRQVCKRLSRRIDELGLPDLSAYRDYLAGHSGEWEILDSLCRVTISRFYRDRGVFDTLRARILPELARAASEAGRDEVRCWCAGCCSGEEAYTLQLLWKIDVIPGMAKSRPLKILATDMDSDVLERARKGIYSKSSLGDLPREYLSAAFLPSGSAYVIRDPFRKDITFARQDIRSEFPEGTSSLILCRNLVFTYFAEDLQFEILERISEKLAPGGILVVGIHESLPREIKTFVPYERTAGIYRKI
ncbi:MCP methyltransferase, CheR-type [Syntrophus gentianae]|uniref:MCP methyltransferase, CheR-type n=1 Tax=Syntrophus gentianae TaxID=43775 RepID=A0A1H8AY57_9BACT|nr:CheR family methyltransferase [Syntrophus gentianae]SEM75680.1 MCP methyltransferase, CheR-type [Syntrophus gentianae]